MLKFNILLPAFLLIIFCHIRLFADIVITNDDMILNGKILEDRKGEFLKFGNYHGIFTIDYKQIKEIFRTLRYEDDVKIFLEKGKMVNEAEVKTNYQAGIEKLEEQKKITDIRKNEEKPKEAFSLFLSPFYNYNFGTLSNKLPQSYGVSAMGHFVLDEFEYIKKMYLSGIAAEFAYFHSEKGVRQVSGSRISAGPLWKFSISIGSFNFKYCIFPELGIGIYNIKGIYTDSTSVKWNILLSTGPIFNFSSVLLYPHIKFDYIYDSVVPLYGIGLGIGAGLRF
jgi:hypothetical protein